MGEPPKLCLQRETNVYKPRAPDRRDSGYTEHRYRHLYQGEELERVAEGHRKDDWMGYTHDFEAMSQTTA